MLTRAARGLSRLAGLHAGLPPSGSAATWGSLHQRCALSLLSHADPGEVPSHQEHGGEVAYNGWPLVS